VAKAKKKRPAKPGEGSIRDMLAAIDEGDEHEVMPPPQFAARTGRPRRDTLLARIEAANGMRPDHDIGQSAPLPRTEARPREEDASPKKRAGRNGFFRRGSS
jgi:hypothetical protein